MLVHSETMPSTYLYFSILCILTSGLSYGSVNLVRLRLRDYLADIPNGRSSHTVPTPRGGGIGFILAFFVSLILYTFCFKYQTVGVLSNLAWISLLPLIVVGIIDDFRGVPSSIRYSVQIAVACSLVWQIGSYPWPLLNSFGIAGEVVGFLLTAVAITACINFYNFMDGLDGLVSICALLQLVFLSILLQQPLVGLLAASLAGFLYWNWSPAKIFMGDIGSTFLGAVVSAVLLAAAQIGEFSQLNSWSMLSIAFPIVADAAYTLIRRSIARENIFQAHRSHIYQRLHQSGVKHSTVALLYASSTILMISTFYYFEWIGGLVNSVFILLSIFTAERFITFNSQENHSAAKESIQLQ